MNTGSGAGRLASTRTYARSPKGHVGDDELDVGETDLGDIVPAASAAAVRVATESNRLLLGWSFHPLVLRALVAH